jgi:uncharacterized membrane protein YqiK
LNLRSNRFFTGYGPFRIIIIIIVIFIITSIIFFVSLYVMERSVSALSSKNTYLSNWPSFSGLTAAIEMARRHVVEQGMHISSTSQYLKLHSVIYVRKFYIVGLGGET